MGPVLLFIAFLADPILWLAMLGLLGFQQFRPAWWAFGLSALFSAFVLTEVMTTWRGVYVGPDGFLIQFALRTVAASVIGAALLLVASWWRKRGLPKP
jgi:hypothetical protein